MTTTRASDIAVRLLTDHGFTRLDGPVMISGVQFHAGAFLIQPDSLDLVVVVEEPNRGDHRWFLEIEAVANALDYSGSRRSLTVVIPGSSPVPAVLDRLARVARVLSLGPDNEAIGEVGVSDALAVLLPLRVAQTDVASTGTWATLRADLVGGADGVVGTTVADAAEQGRDAVSAVARTFLTYTTTTGRGSDA